MSSILIGAQWGDEGKGKIIDILTEEHDMVVRFQGGANAGHTVHIEDKEFVLHLIPSGILRRDKQCVIGNGVVVDPGYLFQEIDALEEAAIPVKGRLFISDQAHLIMPYHKLLDSLHENAQKKKIGTTKRGIGPCYSDKVARLGIRVADLMDPKYFEERLQQVLKEKNQILKKIYGHRPLSFKKIHDEYTHWRTRLRPYVLDTVSFLNDAVDSGKRLLLEGAQGTLLDVDHGTYPYVTSSNATAGGAMTGTGIGPTHIRHIIGVVKAYTTRVGEGPLPTQFPPRLADLIQKKGAEFGATTGRPRRCGWFDAVVARHARRVNGINRLAITKLDVLDELPVIKVAVAYRYKGKVLKALPSSLKILADCKPIYEEHPGWLQDTSKARRFQDLPPKARKYLERLAILTGAKIYMVSVGSERSQTIRMR